MTAIRGLSRYSELLVVSVIGGIALMISFLPASHFVGFCLSALMDAPVWFVPPHWGFTLLASLFWLSSNIKRPKVESTFPPPDINPWLTYVIPAGIALLYGWLLRPGPSVVMGGSASDRLWFLLLVPVGEELLFRGWFYNLIDVRFGGKMLTPTNPFPCAGWASSLAFAIWHVQNWETLGPALTSFQVFYTFVAGMWLSLLRWRTGGIVHSILGHAAINLSASLI